MLISLGHIPLRPWEAPPKVEPNHREMHKHPKCTSTQWVVNPRPIHPCRPQAWEGEKGV